MPKELICVHDWWVHSTALTPPRILVQCQKCGENGMLTNFTPGEWREAFHAPSKPYPWRPAPEGDIVEFHKEVACLRAVLERILRVMDEGLFVDYQMEKFGLIKYQVPEEKKDD